MARWCAALLLAMWWGWLGCQSFRLPPSEEERRAFAQAERAVAAGPEEGREAFESYLRRYPDGALSPDAHLALGALAQEEGDLPRAMRHYAEAADQGGTAGDRARVKLAAIELERGNPVAARRWVKPVRLSRLEGPELRNAYRALAESAETPPERLRWLALLRTAVPEGELSAVDLEIDTLLGQLSMEELRASRRYVGDRPPAARVYLTLAERALEAGDLGASEDAITQAGKRPLAPRYAGRLAAVEKRLRSRDDGPVVVDQLPTFAEVMERPLPDPGDARGAIGVVLPLTGPYARFGEEAMQGVLLASETFPGESATGRPRIRVVVRDSAGNPAQAARAVRDLAADPEIVAIVGPLVSKACEAAAVAAEAEGVPLLTLSARDAIASERDWVFRMRTRPAEEAQLVADRAIALGARRFAILYRDDPYGHGLRRLFWDAVEARGGTVVGVAAYDPKATDFGDSIRRLVGYTLLSSEERSLIARRDRMEKKARRLPAAEARALRRRARSLTTASGAPIPPIVDFDALFIPESADNMVLIAPQLVFHEVTGARILGPDGFYSKELLRLAGNHLDGALFASHFFPESEVPYVADFKERFETTFDNSPDVFAAQSFDAARIAVLQLAEGVRGRGEMREGLLEVEGYPGVSGILTIRGDGNAHKRPYLLGVEKGQVRHYID
ncbi:MAG: penicillin-binding protein activator [Myxococcota bacterium]